MTNKNLLHLGVVAHTYNLAHRRWRSENQNQPDCENLSERERQGANEGSREEGREDEGKEEGGGKERKKERYYLCKNPLSLDCFGRPGTRHFCGGYSQYLYCILSLGAESSF